ncbi:hypothetical protein M3936_14175 [Sutcliffiella horikoshii]|uniref:hypothetical protein n=1 Tax=Sutcliffiella horikoshii TaxID=79883 RepID=UPI00203FA63E|nr:hypothetical protein [Sutcliffiella horikoshii]MCM3618734.1 hypothetical protein [Sutcliffiella horikoshii]
MSKTEVNVENAQVNLMLEVNGKIHLVAMDKEKLETIEFMIKRATSAIIPTEKTQEDLLAFLNNKGDYGRRDIFDQLVSKWNDYSQNGTEEEQAGFFDEFRRTIVHYHMDLNNEK